MNKHLAECISIDLINELLLTSHMTEEDPHHTLFAQPRSAPML